MIYNINCLACSLMSVFKNDTWPACVQGLARFVIYMIERSISRPLHNNRIQYWESMTMSFHCLLVFYVFVYLHSLICLFCFVMLFLFVCLMANPNVICWHVVLPSVFYLSVCTRFVYLSVRCPVDLACGLSSFAPCIRVSLCLIMH